MDFYALFTQQLDALKKEGNYRIFAEMERKCGSFPKADNYGPDGKRKNTRAVRWRERYTAQRQDVLEQIMNLNPNHAARKTMSHLLARKRVKKIPIPIHKHPN